MIEESSSAPSGRLASRSVSAVKPDASAKSVAARSEYGSSSRSSASSSSWYVSWRCTMIGTKLVHESIACVISTDARLRLVLIELFSPRSLLSLVSV